MKELFESSMNKVLSHAGNKAIAMITAYKNKPESLLSPAKTMTSYGSGQ